MPKYHMHTYAKNIMMHKYTRSNMHNVHFQNMHNMHNMQICAFYA